MLLLYPALHLRTVALILGGNNRVKVALTCIVMP